MNASSHEQPNSDGFFTAPITDNTAPTAIKTAGAFRHPDRSSGGGNGVVSLGELMIYSISKSPALSEDSGNLTPSPPRSGGEGRGEAARDFLTNPSLQLSPRSMLAGRE